MEKCLRKFLLLAAVLIGMSLAFLLFVFVFHIPVFPVLLMFSMVLGVAAMVSVPLWRCNRKTEEQFRETSEYLEKLLNYANAPMIVWDADFNITRFNGAFERLTGYMAENVKGKNLEFLFPEAIRDASMTLITTAMKGTHWESEEVQVLRRDGEVRTLLWNSATILAPDGETVTATIAQGQDITDRKKAIADRERLQVQLAQMQKMESVGRLAGGVAHDFNNMLQAIMATAEMALEHTEPNSRVYADLQEIIITTRKASSLPRQLLAFARRQPSQPRVVDMNALVTGMLGMMRRLVGESIEIIWVPCDSECLVNIDPGQMDQVLANLFVNARDAIRGAGKIKVDVWTVYVESEVFGENLEIRSGHYVGLTVSDNGCGMDADTQEKIFEPFFTTKEDKECSGLGLATVYGIVKQNGGFIQVYSQPGAGTTFKLHFPQQTKSIPADDAPTSPQEMVRTGDGKTLLMVEDEPSILKMGQKLLQHLGYRVLVANTPAVALQLIDTHPGIIDLLLTDVMLPEMNGKELARRLREKQPSLKCLFMSGYTASVLGGITLAEQTDHFLQKPFTRKSLADAVHDMLFC